MKKVCALVLALLIMCASSIPAFAETYYDDEDGGAFFDLPDGWFAYSSTGDTKSYYTSAKFETSSYCEMIYAAKYTNEDLTEFTKDYAATVLPSLFTETSNMTDLNSKYEHIHFRRWCKVTGTLPSGDYELNCTAYFYYNSNMVYMFMLFADDTDDSYQQFKSVISTFDCNETVTVSPFLIVIITLLCAGAAVGLTFLIIHLVKKKNPKNPKEFQKPKPTSAIPSKQPPKVPEPIYNQEVNSIMLKDYTVSSKKELFEGIKKTKYLSTHEHDCAIFYKYLRASFYGENEYDSKYDELNRYLIDVADDKALAVSRFMWYDKIDTALPITEYAHKLNELFKYFVSQAVIVDYPPTEAQKVIDNLPIKETKPGNSEVIAECNYFYNAICNYFNANSDKIEVKLTPVDGPTIALDSAPKPIKQQRAVPAHSSPAAVKKPASAITAETKSDCIIFRSYLAYAYYRNNGNMQGAKGAAAELSGRMPNDEALIKNRFSIYNKVKNNCEDFGDFEDILFEQFKLILYADRSVGETLVLSEREELPNTLSLDEQIESDYDAQQFYNKVKK